MKRIIVEEGIEIIKSESYIVNEDMTLVIPKSISSIEKNAIVGSDKTNKFNLVIEYQGTTDEWRNILKGTEEQWTEYSDYSPSYGSGVYSQRYSWYYHYFKDVNLPVKIRCLNGDIEDNGKQGNKYIIVQR